MSTPINLQKPLNVNGQDVYPQTTVQQVLMPDGRRLNTVMDEEYELITSITTTEEVSSLHITSGNDGNAYALKKAIFKVITPTATVSKPFVLFVNYLYALYLPKLVDTKAKETTMCVNVVNNRLLIGTYGCAGVSNSGQSDGGVLYYPVLYRAEATHMYHFQVYGVNSAVLPVGTTIEVWGVRA